MNVLPARKGRIECQRVVWMTANEASKDDQRLDQMKKMRSEVVSRSRNRGDRLFLLYPNDVATTAMSLDEYTYLRRSSLCRYPDWNSRSTRVDDR